MSKDDLCLKAATTLSGLFRRAACALDAFTSDASSWEGIFPHPLQFEEQDTATGVELRYPLRDIGLPEVSVVHDGSQVFLNINPICNDYLIHSFDSVRQYSPPLLDDDSLAKYADLRWDSVSEEELVSFFRTARAAISEDFWVNRAVMLLCLAFAIAKQQAKDRGEPVSKKHVRETYVLDKLLEAKFSRRLPESLQVRLEEYLVNLPGYSEDDALNGALSAKAYEQHGYLSMQLANWVSIHQADVPSRNYRLLAAAVEYTSTKPISKVTAKAEDGVLIISLECLPAGLRRVEIES